MTCECARIQIPELIPLFIIRRASAPLPLVRLNKPRAYSAAHNFPSLFFAHRRCLRYLLMTNSAFPAIATSS